MTLKLVRDGAIGRLMIERPDKRNAFSMDMWERLPVLLTHAMADRAIRVLIVQSSESGVFSAGADVGEFVRNRLKPSWRGANQEAINKAQYELARIAKPTIAFVDGDAIGGGCALAMACDIRVATPLARFGITPAKLGLVYPLHDTRLLVELVGPSQAKRLLFTAGLIDAEEALRIGLADIIAPTADDLAREIASNSSYSVTELKAMVRRIQDGQLTDSAETLRIFADAFTRPDFIEGAAAFAEKKAAAI